MKEIKEPFFPKLEAELALRGLNYTTFGKLLGLSTHSISSRMNGKVCFSMDEIKMIMKIFQKKFEDLF